MTITDDKEILDTSLPRELSFYPGATDTEQAVVDTAAIAPFKWIISDASVDIVIETTYGSFVFYDSSTVTPGGFLPVANGKRVVTSHAFTAPLGTKTTGSANFYLYGGI